MKKGIFVLFGLLLVSCQLLEKINGFKDRTASDPLPHLMKGYELYTWQDGNDWVFTLVAGTNAIKTMNQIYGDMALNENEPLPLRVQGINNVKTVLARLPNEESVAWRNGTWLTGDRNGRPVITLPPESVTSDIQAWCQAQNLDLTIHSTESF